VKRPKKSLKAAIAATGVDATLTKVTDFQEIAKTGYFFNPCGIADGDVKSVGNIPKQSDVEGWLSA